MPDKKKNIKVRDLKPSKDAKGGSGRPQPVVAGGNAETGRHPVPQGGIAPSGGGGNPNR